ncbi:MAG: hypothetical protein JNL52_03040 [Flavobacteriales bacterium]|nr:hypothetical protein [Flavobacteriales bacterium]
MPSPKNPTPYVSVFELMTERGLLAVLRKATKVPTCGMLERLQGYLVSGKTIRALSPRAWEPGGSLLTGGYGFAARPLANGLIELTISLGSRGEASQLFFEVELGPRDGVRYFKELGFATN